MQASCDSLTWIDGNTYTANNNTATFTLSNAQGCDSVITLDLTINVVDTSTTISNNTISSNATTGATYQWIDCSSNNSISGETAQSFTATANGDYAVIITVGNCSDTSACVNIAAVGVEEKSRLNEISIYPNPTNGLIYIDLGDQSELINYSMSTVEGKIVNEKRNINTNKITLDLKDESNGIYLLKIEDKSSVRVYKIIKE